MSGWRYLSPSRSHGNRYITKALKHDPRNLNAAREIVCGLHLNAYGTLEDMLLQAARDVIEPTGWKLAMASADTFRLDPPKSDF